MSRSDKRGSPPAELAGHVAFVTGGAQGLGLGLAAELLKRGARVAVADVQVDALERARDTLRPRDPEDLMLLPLDVRDAGAWEAAAAQAETGLGEVSILCANAGVSPARPTLDELWVETTTADEWKWVIDVNMTGVFNALRTFLPRMKKQDRPAHILATASMASVLPFPKGVPAAYTASKYGLLGLCDQVRLELFEAGTRHIGLSVLFPGMIRTNIFRNTLALSPERDRSPESRRAFDDYLAALPATHDAGAPPRALAKLSMDAMLAGKAYIFATGEFNSHILRRQSAIMGALGHSPGSGAYEGLWPEGFDWTDTRVTTARD
jgi:NAD(P)-dependent dehydrogenase (short-subunit alcohol dehydrogenase family)